MEGFESETIIGAVPKFPLVYKYNIVDVRRASRVCVGSAIQRWKLVIPDEPSLYKELLLRALHSESPLWM